MSIFGFADLDCDELAREEERIARDFDARREPGVSAVVDEAKSA